MLLPGITLPVPIPSKNEPSIKHFLPWWKSKHLLSLSVLPELPIYRTCVQQSSSHSSPVLKKGHTCGCQPVTTVRELFSPQFPFLQRVRSMKSASLTMLKVDKACVWQTPQTLCEEDCFVADAAVLRLPGILSLPGITLPSIELLPCWKKNFCPSSMSCQCCQGIGHSCSNPVFFDHQYRTESTHACVKQ